MGVVLLNGAVEEVARNLRALVEKHDLVRLAFTEANLGTSVVSRHPGTTEFKRLLPQHARPVRSDVVHPPYLPHEDLPAEPPLIVDMHEPFGENVRLRNDVLLKVAHRIVALPKSQTVGVVAYTKDGRRSLEPFTF